MCCLAFHKLTNTILQGATYGIISLIKLILLIIVKGPQSLESVFASKMKM